MSNVKVNLPIAKEPVTFKEIGNYEFFLYNQQLYCKYSGQKAFNVEKKWITGFSSWEKVIPVDVEINVKYKDIL
jgi:hypothetical protein